jgi:RHS repeat-associated protein
MRTATSTTSSLVYFLTDHLGSTSITVNPDGSKAAEMRYTAWGETRYTQGVTPTDYQYTGQSNESAIGLYYYNARWYDSALGRFVQADTVVPGGVQGLDRYAYVNNSPIMYTDPSGHNWRCGPDGVFCDNDPSNDHDFDILTYNSIEGATVALSDSASALYKLYTDFKSAGWWKDYSDDPLLLFLALILSREGRVWMYDAGWFKGDANDPAKLFGEAGARWFWSWAKSDFAKQTFGAMKNSADQVAMLFNWFSPAMQSEDNVTLDLLKEYSTISDWNSNFLGVAKNTVNPPNPDWKSGDGMWRAVCQELCKFSELLASFAGTDIRLRFRLRMTA